MHPQPHDLTALAYGLISGAERHRLLEHLATCDDCRAAHDAAFEEQAVVREALVADVRSGAVEARALDRTLAALAMQADLKADAGQPAGRLFRLPRAARYALEAAAVLLVGAGLFALMQPGAPLNRGSGIEPGPVADNRNDEVVRGPVAAAKVSGVVFASDKEGNLWEKTTEIPVGRWIRTDRDQPATVSFENGLVCDLSPDTEFVVHKEGGDGVYSIRLRAGFARVDAVNVLQAVPVETANREVFFALPGSALNVSLRRADGTQPNPAVSTAVQATQGEVMLVAFATEGSARGISLLKSGEEVRIDGEARKILWLTEGQPEITLYIDYTATSSEVTAAWVKAQKARLENVQLHVLPEVIELGGGNENLRRLVAELTSRGTAPQTYVLELDYSQVEKKVAEGRYELMVDGQKFVLTVKIIDGVRNYNCQVTDRDGKTSEVTAQSLEELSKKQPSLGENLKLLLGSGDLDFNKLLPTPPPVGSKSEDKGTQRVLRTESESR